MVKKTKTKLKESMKTILSITLAVMFLLSITVTTQAYRNGMYINEDGDLTPPMYDQIQGGTQEDLTPEEIQGLEYMREEEKLARDVYLTLNEKWNLRVFENIARSEETHTNAVKKVLEAYNIQYEIPEEKGVFLNPELQALYDSLVEEGLKSEVDALKVGAKIEDLDIYDLEERLKTTNNEDIKMLYENLKEGSYNHLRAFTRQLELQGETYTPEYITQEEYEMIISQEPGRNMNYENHNLTEEQRKMIEERQKERQQIIGERQNMDVAQKRMQENNMKNNYEENKKGYGNGVTNRMMNKYNNTLEVVQGLKQYRGKYSNIIAPVMNQYENNYQKAVEYENKIQKRSFITKLFFGGDKQTAEELLNTVKENEQLIQQLKTQLMNANDAEAEEILAQINALQEQNLELKKTATEEMNRKGLFRWW